MRDKYLLDPGPQSHVGVSDDASDGRTIRLFSTFGSDFDNVFRLANGF